MLEKKYRFCCRRKALLNPLNCSICSYYVTVMFLFSSCFVVLCFVLSLLLFITVVFFSRYWEVRHKNVRPAFILWIDEFISSIHVISQIAYFLIHFFHPVFRFPTANFGPLSRGHPHYPMLVTVLLVSTRRLPEAS